MDDQLIGQTSRWINEWIGWADRWMAKQAGILIDIQKWIEGQEDRSMDGWTCKQTDG